MYIEFFGEGLRVMMMTTKFAKMVGVVNPSLMRVS
jgi:hypothetical protein